MISEKATGARISVIIPLGGIIPELSSCLDSLKRSRVKPAEVILVDDSPDGDIDERLGAGYKVVRSSLPGGVSSARNTGAFHAGEELVLFIDSDIVLKPDTLEKILNEFSRNQIDGLVGVQSLELPFDDFPTQYKNLWMNFTYTNLPDFVPLFYTSCAAIKKEVFLESGGFDRNYRMPSLEDTVFGRRLQRKGKKIKLCRHIEVVHLKKYSLIEVLVTDFKRASALTKVVLRERGLDENIRGSGTSVPISFKFGIIFPPLGFLCVMLLLVTQSVVFAALLLVLSILMVLLNLKFLVYIQRNKGLKFLLKSIAFLHLDYIFVDLGIMWGVLSFLSGKRY